jgi:phosphoglycolate phosphatase-like HAD superfamily hydrolase
MGYNNRTMLIFDFDGVLINSLDEVTLTVYNTATGKLATSLTDLPPALAGLFQRNRHHVQPIGDGILLMDWCLNHYRRDSDTILNPREYETIISGSEESTAERTIRIYETRTHFIEKDPECWLALHQPYQPLWNELIRRQTYPFVILTNKNRDATLRLCRHFGLNIQTIDVYSGDKGVSKTENMQQIQGRYESGPYYFIEDSVKNLQELDAALNRQKKKVFIPLLASWGYTGPEDEKFARKFGYAILKQTDAILFLDKKKGG